MKTHNNSMQRITRKRLRELWRSYPPLGFEEVDPDDPRYRVPMHYVLKNEDRLLKVIKVAERLIPDRYCNIADIGTYPGSLLRILSRWFGPDKIQLFGVGLITSDEFKQQMLDDCGAIIHTVNLDPRNDQLINKNYSNDIPMESDSVDVSFVLEVMEHMVSPSHLFSEVYRICKPGGYVIVTTPNVTRIGNIFKLIAGLSNFDRLIPPDYYDPDDEWRPHSREYTLKEVCRFLLDAGFQIQYQAQVVVNDTRFNIKSFRQRLINVAKTPFYMISRFRGDLLVVAGKP